NQDAHADFGFAHSVAQALQKRVLVVEAGKHFLDGVEDTAFVGLFGIASAWTGIVRVEVVKGTAAVAIVKPGAGEVFAVFHVGRAAEADLAVRMEDAQRVDDSLLLCEAEARGLHEESTNGGEVVSERDDVWRIIREGRKSFGNFGAKDLAAGKLLVQESIPQIKREGDG